MDCNKSSELIMKYMDKLITEKEAKLLNEHISKCPKCEAEFEIYDEIMLEFDKTESIEAPLDFEETVMKLIMADGFVHQNVKKKAELTGNMLVGLMSVLFTAGFFMVVYRNEIIQALSKTALLGGYAESMTPFINIINQYTLNIQSVFSEVYVWLMSVVSDFKWYFLAALVIVLVVQFFVRSKTQVEE